MFLKNVVEHRRALLEAATSLHQSGEIKPNTWVIDLDLVAENASALADEAVSNQLTTFLMTKQYNRNPLVTQVALSSGINSTVAVDVAGAKAIHRYGLPLGHVGHLCQIPRHEMKTILSMKPKYMTLYGYENARFASEAASELGLIQKVFLKFVDHGDLFFPGQESGIWLDDLETETARIAELPNIEIVGLTAFPCVKYNVDGKSDVTPTPNLYTLRKAKERIEAVLRRSIDIVNAPGNTSTKTMERQSELGVTIVEPGHGLTGTTPDHIYDDQLPEQTAMVYVSEISHHFKDNAYAFGGGLYICLAGGPLGYPAKALVGASVDEMLSKTNEIQWEQVSRDNIDYYAMLNPGNQCNVGDTVIFGFRAQSFVTRAYVAAVSGISEGKPVVEGVFDPAGHLVDAYDRPQSSGHVMDIMKKLDEKYRRK